MSAPTDTSPFEFPTVLAFTLTGPAREAYQAGYWDGYLDRPPEIDQAEADADRYYRAAYPPTPTRLRRPAR